MDASALVQTLKDALPDGGIEGLDTVDLNTTIRADAAAVPALARLLRDRPDLHFALLVELTAVDHLPRAPRFEVIYLLVSIEHRLRLRVKVALDGADPHVATVSDVWPAANWLEREVWDLFGIAFDGHPDPRRLLMPEDWDGYPLRKDFPVQINMAVTTASPLQVTEEEFRANLERDRLARG